MATLARLAADANMPPKEDTALTREVASSATDRAAGQGVTAAIAGLAA
jgi:hypothetical protein